MSFLGIETSLTGREWLGPTLELDRAAEHLAQQTALPRAVAQVLARRGVAAEEAESFLTPSIRELLPDPRSLKDMEKATARFLEAVAKGEKIAIFADYDVDGGSSAALLIDWLRRVGREATLYIPDRIDEGYGPNVPAMQALAADHSLIVCVDCGTLSHEPIAAAEGADVVVLMTEWDEFRALDPAKLGAVMARRRAVDLRNVWDRAGFEAHGFAFDAVGRPGPERETRPPALPVPARQARPCATVQVSCTVTLVTR